MKVGPYELVGSLGRGATSEVFRGRGPDGAEVAVKVFSHRSGSPEALDRFGREVRLQRALGAADGVVPILDAGETALGSWLAMPLLGGGPLRERLRGVPWKVDDVVQLGRTLAAALGRAHALGIVHRDVKPENILYDDAGRPLLADLGLAKHFRSDVTGASASLALTRSGALVGTVGYMAPEQASDGRSAGPPADVFSLGAILYEALTGRYAFEGSSPMEVLARLSHARVEPVRRVRPDAPAWLADAIERALDPDPARRHASGAELARALTEGARAAPRRRPSRALLAGLLLLGAGGALAVAGYEAGERAGQRSEPLAGLTNAADPAAAAARERLRAARLLGELALATDLAAVRSLALRIASVEPGEAALLRAEAALGEGRPDEADAALATVEDESRRRLLAAFAALARRRSPDQVRAGFEALAAAGPLAAEAQLGAVRAALERDDAASAGAGLERAARLVGPAAGPALRTALERGRVELRALEAAGAARAGTPGPGLSIVRGEGQPAASRAVELRRLARGLFAAPGAPLPPAAEQVAEALLQVAPGSLAQPDAVEWLLARTARVATKDPLAAARSAEVLRLLDDTTPLPPELGPALDTHSVSALLGGDEAQWLEGALAGLRLGRTASLFPLGADAARQGAIELLLARRVAARPDDWAARLFLARCLVRGEPPDHEERLARAEAAMREVLVAPIGTAARPLALETLGLVLAHQRRLPEAQAAFEAALAAWHPAPDQLLLDLSHWSRDADPGRALAWAERAVAVRDARARGEAEAGRPGGLPLAAVEHPRGRQAALVEVRLVLVERALAQDRRARALEVARDCARLESPGPLAARLARAAVAASAGEDAAARAEVEPLRASTGQDREELTWLAPWLVNVVKRSLRRKELARLLATDLGVE